jgi:hypothetical protein
MRRLGITITVALAAAAAVVANSIGAAGSTTFKVASTLDGKTVLPHRIHWLGLPKLAPAQVKEVDFLVDGKVRWIEHHPPYVYGDDDGHQHRGYLVTSWLSPGKHRFTVQAVASDGRRASDTVVARVLPTPEVPAELAGTWQRTIDDTSAAPKPKSTGDPTETLTPPGRYQLTFDRRWIFDVFPCDTTPCRFNEKTGGGNEFVSDWTPNATTFRVDGTVTFRVGHNTDRLYSAGSWCWRDGPSATYTWNVSGDTLTLAPVGGHDACGIRGFIWSGQWTRVR